ncbi:hypothetical protein [Dietzia natronolimnaea]|uniref:hypothetical protein n=1 Tax=Dietzia natronolimnaea TaxID=161920 RepID=UPI001140D246|nr:hypothetical protein [Dietzia natronolimnaea]
MGDAIGLNVGEPIKIVGDARTDLDPPDKGIDSLYFEMRTDDKVAGEVLDDKGEHADADWHEPISTVKSSPMEVNRTDGKRLTEHEVDAARIVPNLKQTQGKLL